MTDMKTWEVHFTVTLPGNEEWNEVSWDGSTREYMNINPGADDPYICVPADAVITEIANPLKDGFYLCNNSRAMYHRLDGKWLYWSDSYEYWRNSSLSDADVQSAEDFERINAVV